jgi:hypothetical protein
MLRKVGCRKKYWLRLRLAATLAFNELFARMSGGGEPKAEDKYKKPIFVLLLESLLIANHSRLTFP